MIACAIHPKPPTEVKPMESSRPKPSYPEFSLRDELMTKFKEEHGDVDVGDEMLMTVKVKVNGMQDREFGKSIDFCITTIESVESEEVSDDGKEEEDEGEKEKDDEKNPAVSRLKKKVSKKY